MALNFEDKPFFQGIPEEEHLKERWQQEGSQLISVNNSSTEDEVVYSVPAGYVFYLTGVQAYDTVNSRNFALKDGSGGSTLFAGYLLTAYINYSFSFSTPIEFTSGVYVATNDPIDFSITGWIEKA